MGKWGKMKFKVAKSNYAAIKTLSAKSEIKKEKSKSKKKKTELEEINITAIYNASLGDTPQEAYDDWKNLIKKVNPLYLHGAAWDGNDMQLQSVSLDSVVLDDYGRVRAGEIKLKFLEKNKKPKNKKKAKKAAASEAKKNAKKRTSRNKKLVKTQAGSKVRIIATNWVDGSKVDATIKKRNVTVTKVSGNKSYIAEADKWVYTNSLSLVK